MRMIRLSQKEILRYIAMLGLLTILGIVVRELIVMEKPWDLQHVPKMLANNETPQLKDIVHFTQWYAFLAIAGGLLLLAGTIRYWFSWERLPTVLPSQPLKCWFIIALTSIVVLGTGVRSVRISQSFHGDEVWGFGDYAFGKFKIEKRQALTFKRYLWDRTLYFNRESNNHILQNLLSRKSLSFYQKINHKPRDYPNEAAIRLPSLIAGVLAILFLGLAVHRFAGPWAGLLAAVLLTIHPTHLRYSAEARGYSLMFFFATLALWAMARAWDKGRWRDWFLFALALGGMCYSWLGSLHAAIFLGIAALYGIYQTRKHSGTEIQVQLMRLAVTTCLVGMGLAPLLAPSFPQVKRFLTFSTRMHGHNDLHWAEDTTFLNFTGTHYLVVNPQLPKNIVFKRSSDGHQILGVIVVAGMIAGVGTALLYLWKRRGDPQLAAFLALPLSIFPSWIHASLNGNDLKPQYVLAPIPGLCALIAIGWWLWIKKGRAMETHQLNLKRVVIPLCLILLWGVYSFPHVSWILRNPTEDLRASVVAARGEKKLYDRETTKVYTMNLWRRPAVYDPRCYAKPLSGREMDELIRKVRRERGELWVTEGYKGMAKALQPEVWQRLSDTDLFEEVKTIPGFYALANLTIYRLKKVH